MFTLSDWLCFSKHAKAFYLLYHIVILIFLNNKIKKCMPILNGASCSPIIFTLKHFYMICITQILIFVNNKIKKSKCTVGGVLCFLTCPKAFYLQQGERNSHSPSLSLPNQVQFVHGIFLSVFCYSYHIAILIFLNNKIKKYMPILNGASCSPTELVELYLL